MAIMAAPQIRKAWRHEPAAPENAAYYSANLEQRMTYATLYLVLVVVLALMVGELHDMLGSARAGRST